MREEPLPVAERVGVLGARRADGGEADVRDEGVGADVLGHVDEADLGAIVDGTTLEEDLAALVKADYALGQSIGIQHTPTIWVVTSQTRGTPFVEVVDRTKLYSMIDDALAETKGSAPEHAGTHHGQ